MFSLKLILSILLVYFVLYLLIRGYRLSGLPQDEKKTLWILGACWAIIVFGGNYLLYRLGIMSYTPWLLNFIHCFIWIGLVLPYLHLSTRFTASVPRQILYFVAYSFIVKMAERQLLGAWEHDHFFWIFSGDFAYILGWSILDGLYPLISKFGLRILSNWVDNLIVD